MKGYKKIVEQKSFITTKSEIQSWTRHSAVDLAQSVGDVISAYPEPVGSAPQLDRASNDDDALCSTQP